MERGDGIICRLCSKIYNAYEKMENKIEILDSLSKLSLEVRRGIIICKNCGKILQNFLYFKRRCLDTENLIRTRVNSMNPTKLLYLEEVMEAPASQDRKQLFCRFCLELAKENYFTFLYDLDERLLRKMLEKILPELNLNLTKNPIICTACYESLQIYSAFINNCLTAQRNKNEDEPDYINLIIFSDLEPCMPSYVANVNNLENTHSASAVETNTNENIDNNIVIDAIVSKEDNCMDLLRDVKVTENIQNNQTDLLAVQDHLYMPMIIRENYGANTELNTNSCGDGGISGTEPGGGCDVDGCCESCTICVTCCASCIECCTVCGECIVCCADCLGTFSECIIL